ncbi:hypothetical protein B0H11DRAFT_1930366 [Mycena galericulata]|nr:hypothetical protein B0H11DRAFT_1930366 [Mycena galericulata]
MDQIEGILAITEKRPPGRPKGSKKKKKKERDASISLSKPRGRPPGTGHLQSAHAERLVADEPEPSPEPTARPYVKGVSDPTRQCHIAESAALIQKNNIGSISVPTASRTFDAPHLHPFLYRCPHHQLRGPSEATARRLIPEVDPSAPITLPEDEDGNLPALYRDLHTFWLPETRCENWITISGQHLLYHRLPIPVSDLCNPDSKLKTVTFHSWDSRILRKLPHALAASFFAMLTYRSGLERVFMSMRSCFQSGMCTKQFADTLRVRHLENYDKLHISYLLTLSEHAPMARFTERKLKTFLPFDDTSAERFHGFLPSSQWFRDLFDKFVEEHGHEYDQHTALLTAFIAAIHHSFEACKTHCQGYIAANTPQPGALL